jgi:hypothetical protein
MNESREGACQLSGPACLNGWIKTKVAQLSLKIRNTFFATKKVESKTGH